MRKKSTRIISAALAAAMMLSVCPVSAFATYRQAEAEKAVAAYAAAQANDEENGSTIGYEEPGSSEKNPIVIELKDDGTPKDANGTGWTYSDNTGITITGSDYYKLPDNKVFNGNLTVDNGILVSGLVNGFLMANPDGKIYNAISTYGSAPFMFTLEKPATINGVPSNSMVLVWADAEHPIELTADEKPSICKIFINKDNDCSKLSSEAELAPYAFTEQNGKWTLTLPLEASTGDDAPLELDENGYPTESKGGSERVEQDNWVYDAEGKTLFLLDGTFSLNCNKNELSAIYVGFDDDDKTVTLKDSNLSGNYQLIVGTKGIVENGIYNCDTLTNNGTINSGSFNARLVENNGTISSGDFTVRKNVNSALISTGTISGGTFNCSNITNRGTINNGVFTGDRFETFGTINGGTFKAAEITRNEGTISGGVFLFPEKPNDAAAKIALTDTDNLTINGLTLPAGQNSFYVKTNGEETVVLGVPEGYPKPTAWKLTVGDKSLEIRDGSCYFKAGLDEVLEPSLGLESADARRSNGTLILKVTDSSLLSDKLTVSANKPAAKAENYTIKMDGSELTADGVTLAYDANAKRSITVTRKATDDATAAELTADQFTTTITRDGEPVDSIGLPGKYKVTVSIHDGAASGELTGYTFTIEKAKVDDSAMQELLKNFEFKISAEPVAYPGRPNLFITSVQEEITNAGFGYVHLKGYQKQQADGTWSDDIERTPNAPGTYAPVFTVNEGSLYQGITLTYKDYCNSDKIQNKTFKVVAGSLSKDDFAPGKTIGETNPTDVDKDKLGKRHIVYYAQDGQTVVSTDTAPTKLGTYKVGFRYEASEYYEAFDYGPVSGWTYKVKEKPKADQFEVKVDSNTTYTGAHIGAEVTINGSTEGITVKYKDEDDKVTTEKPTKVGTYTVLIDYAGDESYEAVKDLEVGKFTINRADLHEDDFTFDKSDNRVHSDKVQDDYIHITYRRTDEEGPALAFTDELPNIAGTYEITYTVECTANYNSMAETAVAETYTVNKLTAENISESDLLVSIPLLPSYSGKAEEVTADVLDSNKLPGTITVNYYTDEACTEESKLPEGKLPTNAGTYYFTITVGESYNNEEVTLTPKNNSFTIEPASEVVEGEVAVKVPENLYEDKDEKGITLDFGSTGLTEDDVTITYTNTDTSEILSEGTLPKERGTYSYTVKAKTAKGNYAAGTVLAKGEFTIEAKPYPIEYDYSAESGSIPADIANRFSWTAKDDKDKDLSKDDSESFVATVGTSVTLNWKELDAEYSITGLTATYTEDGDEKTVEGTFDKGSKTFTFEMPDAPVSINVSVNGSFPIDPVDPDTDEPINPEPSFPGQVGDDEGFAPAVAVVAGTAALGGAAYLVGTQVYLETVLPAGAAIPHTRAQLAQLLWTNAGKPAPKAVLADTSDTATAIAWCVENNLISAEGKPESYVTRVQVIKAWNAAQNLNKAN